METTHHLSNVQLTGLEIETLQLFADGKTREEVAAKLGIGRETVKTKSETIRHKLGARSIANAVLLALREGLIR